MNPRHEESGSTSILNALLSGGSGRGRGDEGSSSESIRRCSSELSSPPWTGGFGSWRESAGGKSIGSSSKVHQPQSGASTSTSSYRPPSPSDNEEEWARSAEGPSSEPPPRRRSNLVRYLVPLQELLGPMPSRTWQEEWNDLVIEMLLLRGYSRRDYANHTWVMQNNTIEHNKVLTPPQRTTPPPRCPILLLHANGFSTPRCPASLTTHVTSPIRSYTKSMIFSSLAAILNFELICAVLAQHHTTVLISRFTTHCSNLALPHYVFAAHVGGN